MKKIIIGIIASVIGTIAVFALLIAWIFRAPVIPFAETPEDFGGDICFITRDEVDESGKKEYCTLNIQRSAIAEIPSFENEADIYVTAINNYQHSGGSGRDNILIHTHLYDENGELVENIENREIIDRILKKVEEIDHQVMEVRIIVLGGQYFMQADLNVNWQSPCDVYQYSPEDDSLRMIWSFQHKDIIGAMLVDESAFE